MPGAPRAVQDFLSIYLGCSVREIPSGKVTVVASERRTRAELHYGDIFAIWALIRPDRAVVSTRAELAEPVRQIVNRHGLAGIESSACTAELRQLVCTREGAEEPVSCASFVYYYCSRETFRPVTTHRCRLAALDDLPAIRNADLYECWLDQSILTSTCYVALDGNRPVAVCGTFDVPHLADRVADIGLPGTVETHRRSGYGTSVLSAVTGAVLRRNMTPVYSVSIHNSASIATVRSVGYREFGRDFRVRIRPGN